MKSSWICLFINLFVCHVVIGQSISLTAAFAKPRATNHTGLPFPSKASLFADTTNYAGLYNIPYTFLASNYYIGTLGFFCQKEIQIEKALKFPVRFRLGSVAYTDKMEGKGAGVLAPSAKR